MSKPKSGGSALVVDEGSYPMVVKTVNDIGKQTQKAFGSADDDEDAEEKEVNQVIIEAEMPEYEADGETVQSTKAKPALIAMWLNNTASSDRSNLYKLMKACGIKDPANADLDELLSKSFMGDVGHTKSGKPKVKSFAGLPKGHKIGKTYAATNSYYLDESFDPEAFERAPKFAQDKAVVTKEYEKVEAALKAKSTKKKGK
jgi:hypothetical protein